LRSSSRSPLFPYTTLFRSCDITTRQVKRASEVTKNELMREMLNTCVLNAIKFRYVLMDSWFASQENFEFILKKKKHFIAALKDRSEEHTSELQSRENLVCR